MAWVDDMIAKHGPRARRQFGKCGRNAYRTRRKAQKAERRLLRLVRLGA